MKAIVTKYLGPTNTKPSRIVAKAEGVKPIITSCDALDNWRTENKLEHITNHQAAARILAEENGWSTNLVSGRLPDGTWAHCFVPKPVEQALRHAQSVVSGEVALRAEGELGKPFLKKLLSTIKEARNSLNI